VKEEVNPAYHFNTIHRGELGEVSKIEEELEELKDAYNQDCVIMALTELADLYGAIEAHLEKHQPNITMEDLRKMNEATKRAFRSGRR